MSDFGVYNGNEFLKLELKKREWLIEGILREKDSVLFVGNEKSGKSLFIFQLIFSLTSQHPFLDLYSVNRPLRVSYVQLEGELGDSQDRMIRMLKTLDFEPSMFQILFLPPQELHTRTGIFGLREQLSFHKPNVVVIDPIYFAFTGSLSDDEVVRQFIGNIRVLKDSLGCAIVLVHHTHKSRFTNTGDVILEGDESTFGSKFLKAYPDHTILFTYNKRTGVRTFSCDTQRSGDILKLCNLELIEPEPLYFKRVEASKITKSDLIMGLLKLGEHSEGLAAEDIMKKTGLNKNQFYESIKQPLAENKVSKTHTRPVIYRYVKP